MQNQPQRLAAAYGDEFSSFLKLPEKYKKELSKSVEVLCLEWETDSAEDLDVDSLFLTWNGAVSKMSPDDIEVPGYWRPGGGVRVAEDGNDGKDYFRVRIVGGVEEATSLELLPYSAEDWTLVSSQAGLIENMLLRQHSMARFGSCLTVQVSPSISVRLRVQGLETLSCSRHVKDIKEEEEPKGAQGGGIQDNNEDWATQWYERRRKRGLNEEFIALINPRTTVSVVPVLSPPSASAKQSKNEDEDENEDELDEDAYAHALATLSEELDQELDPEAMYKMNRAAIAQAKRACAVSEQAPLARLRLLPQRFHGQVGPMLTDYTHSLTLTEPLIELTGGFLPLGSTAEKKDRIDPDSDRDELMYGETSRSNPNNHEDRLLDLLDASISDEDKDEEPLSIGTNWDSHVCAVHSSYLKTLITSARGGAKEQQNVNVPEKMVLQHMQHAQSTATGADQHYLAHLQLPSPSHSSHSQGLTFTEGSNSINSSDYSSSSLSSIGQTCVVDQALVRSMAVKLVVDDRIRPYHLSAPLAVRRGLGLGGEDGDFTRVRVKILCGATVEEKKREKNGKFEEEVEEEPWLRLRALQPLPSLGDLGQAAGAGVGIEQVKSALLRWRDGLQGTVIIGHGTVLTLFVSLDISIGIGIGRVRASSRASASASTSVSASTGESKPRAVDFMVDLYPRGAGGVDVEGLYVHLLNDIEGHYQDQSIADILRKLVILPVLSSSTTKEPKEPKELMSGLLEGAQNSSNPNNRLLGRAVQRVSDKLTRAALSHVLPQAVWETRFDGPAKRWAGAVLSAPPGAGATTVSRHVADLLRSSSSTLCHVQTLDCRQLKEGGEGPQKGSGGDGIKGILRSLERAFHCAREKAPSVRVYYLLFVICYSLFVIRYFLLVKETNILTF